MQASEGYKIKLANQIKSQGGTYEDFLNELAKIDAQPSLSELQATSQERMASGIEQAKTEQMRQENPILSAIAPRQMKRIATEQETGSLGAATGDVLSLAGRLIDSAGEFAGDTWEQKINNFISETSKTKGDGWASEILRHPATGAAIAIAPLLPTLSGGSALTAGLIEGGAVAGVSQLARLGEGRELSPGEALSDIGLSVALPGFAPAFKKFAPQAKEMVLSAMDNVISKPVRFLSSELTGISKDALDIASKKTGRKKLVEMAGKANEIGDRLLKSLDDIDNNYQFEDKLKLALDDMPEIGPSEVIKSLNQSINKLGNLPNELAAKSRIKGYLDGIVEDFAQYKKTTKDVLETKKRDVDIFGMPKKKKVTEVIKELKPLPANKFRALRKRLDVSIDHTQDGADLFNEAMKKARAIAKDDLIRASAGTPYKETMEQYSKVLDAREQLYKELGTRADVRERRVESFINSLFGKNKTKRQDVMKNLDEVFGQDFTNEIQLTTLANEIVKEGKIPFFPMQFTGRAALGPVTALGAGSINPALAIPPAVLSSPQMATQTLGLSRDLGQIAGQTVGGGMGLAGDIMSNPYLQRTVPGLARIPLRGEQ